MRMPACVLRALRGAVAVSVSCMAIVCLMGASLNAQDSQSSSSQASVPATNGNVPGVPGGMPALLGELHQPTSFVHVPDFSNGRPRCLG